MAKLIERVPDADVLLSLSPEELAGILLFVLRDNPDSQGMVVLNNVENSLWPLGGTGLQYPDSKRNEISLAIREAWNWLEVQGLLIPASGTNGQNGWRVFSRRAQKFATKEDFTHFEQARRLQRESLDSRIAEQVWLAFMRGEFDTAVFHAMKAVEVAVRDAAKLPASDVGVNLMRKAFDPETGPLTDKSTLAAERQARSALFAGAIGSYKNPQSHRDVNIEDPAEAAEIVMLANHLLRVVSARVKAGKSRSRKPLDL